MIKHLYLFLAILFTATVGGVLLPPKASAAINYNRLIDDSVFNSFGTMNAAQIDSFLNARNSCISQNSGFSAPDPIGYNPSDGFLYGGNVSAGTVIAHSAQVYGLNPQVLLVTLQKEQSIVTSTTCSTNTIAKAMGYACPDGGGSYSYSGLNLYTRNGTTYTSVSGICVNAASKAGFTQQVIRATWLLKFSQQRSLGNTSWAVITGNWDNSDDPGTCYGGAMTQGYRKRCSSDPTATYYDGYTTIDGSSVHMDTGGTASLYRYTPHKAGNLNFFNIYSSWFGDPTVDRSHDVPLSGDWNGDGQDTIGVKHGNQYLLDNDNDGFVDASFYYGHESDIPIVGDWDNNGVDTVGLKRGNKYFINNEFDGASAFRFYYGFGSDIPIVGDWDNNGVDTVGLKRGNKYFINNEFDGASAFRFYFVD